MTDTLATAADVPTYAVEFRAPPRDSTPNIDHALTVFGATGFVQAIRRQTISEVLWVLERGANIMNARAVREASLTAELAQRLRAVRDDLADYDRLRLLYVDPDAPAVEDSAA